MLERTAHGHLSGLKPAIGFAASFFAVCCQILLLVALPLAPLASGADPLGNVPICHAEDGTQPAQHAPTQQAPGQPAHDCAQCVLCLAHALPSALLSAAPALPERALVAIARHGVAQPRAPPVRPAAAAQPRGPPSLI